LVQKKNERTRPIPACRDALIASRIENRAQIRVRFESGHFDSLAELITYHEPGRLGNGSEGIGCRSAAMVHAGDGNQ
jgi:hypothetical protein